MTKTHRWLHRYFTLDPHEGGPNFPINDAVLTILILLIHVVERSLFHLSSAWSGLSPVTISSVPEPLPLSPWGYGMWKYPHHWNTAKSEQNDWSKQYMAYMGKSNKNSNQKKIKPTVL